LAGATLDYFNMDESCWESIQSTQDSCPVGICCQVNAKSDHFKIIFEASEPFGIREVVANVLD